MVYADVRRTCRIRRTRVWRYHEGAPVALSREELTSAVHDNLKHVGLETGCAADEPTHEVCFRSEDLSPNVADPALLHAGVFQSYLERVS